MVYNNNIPQPGENISVSQGDILGNFGTGGIDSTSFGFSREHVTMTNTTDGGLHKRVTFQPVADPGSAASTIVQYGKSQTTALGTFTEIFMQSDGTRGPIQMTYGIPSIGAASNTNGYTFLPGGLLLQWGNVLATQAGASFTFPVAFPQYVFAVTLGGRAAGAQSFAINVPSLSAVTVYCQSAAPQTCYVMAIGK